MRKRRAILVDDDPVVLDMLKQFFEWRGYQVIAYGAPVFCPASGGQKGCENPCGDILITDYKMQEMSGLELLQEQMKLGCKIPVKNRAVISGYIDDEVKVIFDEMGCACFDKPFSFTELKKWLGECEERMDLTLPLEPRRKELRRSSSSAVTFQLERSDLCQAEVINRSDSGLCVWVHRQLAMDQRLRLHTETSLESGCFQVRWTRPADQGGYFAGMSIC